MLLKIMEDVSGIPKLEKKIDDLQSSVEFMSKEYHDLLETCKKQENAIIKLENNVELLTKKNSEKKHKSDSMKECILSSLLQTCVLIGISDSTRQ